jgi:hypothetical protein
MGKPVWKSRRRFGLAQSNVTVPQVSPNGVGHEQGDPIGAKAVRQDVTGVRQTEPT